MLGVTVVLLPITGAACGTRDDAPAAEEADTEGVGTRRSALGPASSCFSYCGGGTPSGCWCDAACTGYGDCCSDYTPQCASGGSCANNCTSGGASGGSCYCDEFCVGFGDCCSDYVTVCPSCGVTTRRWRPSVVLEPTPAEPVPFDVTTDPDVGVTGNGNAIAIWRHRLLVPPFTRTVRARWMTASGWSSTLVLGTDASTSPRIEVGSGGHGFAMFGSQEWTFASATGWTDAALASTPVASAVDGSGNKMLLLRSGATLEARRFTTGGVLEASRILSRDNSMVDVASNTGGDFAAVYNIGATLVVGVKQPGVDWRGTTIAPSGSSPRIGIDPGRNLIVTWIDGHAVKALRATGSTFGTTVTVATFAEAVLDLDLATNAYGRAILAWKRDFPGGQNQQIFASRFHEPTGWSAPVLVTDVRASPERPPGRYGTLDVGIDDCGAGHLVYEEHPYTVFARRFTPGSGWGALPTTITSVVERKPRMATAPNGITTIVWDGERDDVFAARFE